MSVETLEPVGSIDDAEVNSIALLHSREPSQSLMRKDQLLSQTLYNLQQASFSPSQQKQFTRTWKPQKAAQMIGRSLQMVRQAEGQGLLPEPKKDQHNRRLGYSLDQINAARDHFKTRPSRQVYESPAIVAFSAYKGGCGKSTLATHFAQYMAIKGYRVLLVDLDPQGTASTLFGDNPDLHEMMRWQVADAQGLEAPEDELHVADFISNELSDLSSCIETSYFPGIDIIPARVGLSQSEYYIAANSSGVDPALARLKIGINQVATDYDIVVMDPPPSLGMLAMSVLNAANGIVIPMMPTTTNFASTKTFIRSLLDNIESMRNAGYDMQYFFEMLVINNLDENRSSHGMITSGMRKLFTAEDLLPSVMRQSAEIDNANQDMQTVYDLEQPAGSRQTYNRCVTYLDRVNQDIELLIRRSWPSHIPALRKVAQA